jgi:hypothetical protein
MTIIVEPVEGGESLYNFTLIDNRAAGRRKETKENIQRIVAYWNSFGIVEHKKVTPGMENQIERNLDIYTIEEIYKAIENYSNIYKSKLTWWDHKWTLEEFLKRQNGVSVFLYKTEVDYIDKFKADSPKAKILINEERQKREAMIRKADQVETKEIEKTKAEQEEEKQMLKEFWKTLSADQKKEIDLAVEKRMEGNKTLKQNFPKAYDDFRAMAYTMETRILRDSLYNNDTDNGSNESTDPHASSIKGVQGG